MRARDTALIRKLCSLGLPPQSLVLSLLPALRQVIPAHSGGVFWVDSIGQMTALYAERLLEPEAMAAYYEKHYKDAVAGFAAAFRKRAQDPDPVSAHSFSPAERDSSYFREILSALDAYHVLYGVLSRQATPYGQVSLYRGAADKPFDNNDKAALRVLVRYLSSGLYDPGRNSLQGDDSLVVEEGLGVVSGSGDVVSATDEWRRLVRLIALDRLSPSEASQERIAVASLLRELSGKSRAAGSSHSSADVVRQTAWGRFVIRRFPLREASRENEHVGLLIRREEPRTVSLLRGAGYSSLSPQQREVALLLAQGKTNPEIAETLGLTLNTASFHVKQVYAKLSVSDRRLVNERLIRLAHERAAIH